MRSVVVLPAPLGPSRPKTSPGPATNDRPSTASTSPPSGSAKRRVSPSTWIIARLPRPCGRAPDALECRHDSLRLARAAALVAVPDRRRGRQLPQRVHLPRPPWQGPYLARVALRPLLPRGAPPGQRPAGELLGAARPLPRLWRRLLDALLLAGATDRRHLRDPVPPRSRAERAAPAVLARRRLRLPPVGAL